MSQPRSSDPSASTLSTVGPTYSSQICESDTASERSSGGNLNVRQKRRRDDDEFKDLKRLISSLSAKVEQNFAELKQNNEELKGNLQFITDKYDTILKTLQNLQQDRAEDRRVIIRLEEKIEALERKNRSSCIEIRNVPSVLRSESKFENKEDSIEIVKNLSQVIGIQMNDTDIRDIYRVTTHKEGIKPIVVELNSVIKKERLLQGIKSFNRKKHNSDKLNSGHLKVPGPARPVFISEALTLKAQKIFHAARQFARENGFSYCWTSRGYIYLRRSEGDPQIRIDSESSLSKIATKV